MRSCLPARCQCGSDLRRTPLGSVTLVMLLFVEPVRGSSTLTPRCRRAAIDAVMSSGQMPMWLRSEADTIGIGDVGDAAFRRTGARVIHLDSPLPQGGY